MTEQTSTRKGDWSQTDRYLTLIHATLDGLINIRSLPSKEQIFSDNATDIKHFIDTPTKEEKAQTEVAGMTNRNTLRLAVLYDELNQHFFSGRLPRYRVLRKPLRAECNGQCLNEKRTILLHRELVGEKLRKVLLHEMCHIGSPGHDKRFRRKLKRLALMGETWATKEAQAYAEACASLQPPAARLKYAIEDGAIDAPGLSWIKARTWLSRELGVSPRELIKKYPWAKAKWKRECREAKEL